MYSVSAYFFAKVFSDLPISLSVPIAFGSIVYFVVGLNTVYWWKFLLFLIILVILYMTAGSYALIISSVVSTKQRAVSLVPVLVIPLMLFAGFYVS